MEEQKKVNPLATEKEGKLIAKFAIPAIISMLVSSLYNIVDQIFIGQGVGLLGNAATNIDDRRQPSDPCRQKPDVFYDLYADRSDYQYDSGSIIYLRIPLGNQRCCMGDGDRTDRIRDYGNRIFRTIP